MTFRIISCAVNGSVAPASVMLPNSRYRREMIYAECEQLKADMDLWNDSYCDRRHITMDFNSILDLLDADAPDTHPDIDQSGDPDAVLWRSASLLSRQQSGADGLGHGGRNAVSMFDAKEFITDTREAIKIVRRKAFLFELAGRLVTLIGMAVVIIGVIGVFTQTPPQYMTQALRSPTAIGFLLWSGGLIWFGTLLRRRSEFFSQRASEAETNLNFQAPFLRMMQVTQSAVAGDIFGDGNVVNSSNIINDIHDKGDKKGWWAGPVGTIVAGVITLAIGRFLHLS
jgi:hypothetical protein